jgi:hypothetical protein
MLSTQFRVCIAYNFDFHTILFCAKGWNRLDGAVAERLKAAVC